MAPYGLRGSDKMIGISILQFVLWLTEKLFPGPVTGMAHDDEEMGEDKDDDDDWPGRIYIEEDM